MSTLLARSTQQASRDRLEAYNTLSRSWSDSHAFSTLQLRNSLVRLEKLESQEFKLSTDVYRKRRAREKMVEERARWGMGVSEEMVAWTERAKVSTANVVGLS